MVRWPVPGAAYPLSAQGKTMTSGHNILESALQEEPLTIRAPYRWPQSASSAFALSSSVRPASTTVARSPNAAIAGRTATLARRVFHALTPTPNGVRHQRACGSLRPYTLAALAALCLMTGSPAAFAHVKWFSHFDVAEQPVLLEQAISGAFCKLIALALFVFFMAALLDRSPFGTFFQRALDWVTAPIHHNIDTLMLVPSSSRCGLKATSSSPRN